MAGRSAALSGSFVRGGTSGVGESGVVPRYCHIFPKSPSFAGGVPKSCLAIPSSCNVSLIPCKLPSAAVSWCSSLGVRSFVARELTSSSTWEKSQGLVDVRVDVMCCGCCTRLTLRGSRCVRIVEVQRGGAAGGSVRPIVVEYGGQAYVTKYTSALRTSTHISGGLMCWCWSER